MRPADELAVVARHLDLVGALQASELRVDGVARPHVGRAVLPRVEHPADEGGRHVAGADEADLLH